MCVKFGDDPRSSLDFSFIGGVPLSHLIKKVSIGENSARLTIIIVYRLSRT